MPFIDPHNFEHQDADIFLSCSHSADSKKVDLLAERLSNHGFKLFYTREAMRPGYSYDDIIRRYLQACTTIVVCWSPSAIASTWVNAEAEYGRVNNKLVSCKVVACDLMPPFNTFQTTNLIGWEGEDDHPTWKTLINLLEHRRSGLIRPHFEFPQKAPPSDLSWKWKYIMSAAVATALIVGIAIGFSLRQP